MIGSVPDPGIHGLGALHKLLSFPDAVSSPVNWHTCTYYVGLLGRFNVVCTATA